MTDVTRYELSRCSAAQICTSSVSPARYRLLRASNSAGTDDSRDAAVMSTFTETPLRIVLKDRALRGDPCRGDGSGRISGEFDTLKYNTSWSVGAAM